jgi:hypothetical protein
MKIINDQEIIATPIFHERGFVHDHKLIFVLMPFGEPWSDRIWDAIQRIITGLGLRAERADNRHGPVVTEDIWRGIVESKIVLADVTGWNPNVFYEIGISHTLGKDVILITQPSARLPFDTQGFRHIIYSDNPSGIKLLEKEIPLKIDYYFHRKIGYKNNKTSKKLNKKDILDSWNAITKNWDPPLPSLEVKDLRSTVGALKKRMKQYVYVLSEPDAKSFVLEVRKVWPDNLESRTSTTEIQNIIEQITTVLNEWRNRYSEKLNK